MRRKDMFVNFTNHPSDTWDNRQMEAAEAFGAVVDLPFPCIPADAVPTDIARLADKYFDIIDKLSPSAVLVQGEMTFTFAVVERLKAAGIRAVCACTKRQCECTIDENGSTKKIAVFKFVQYRDFI